MEIVILAARSIWIVRNNKNFKNQRPTFHSWKAIYVEELRMVEHRMKKKHAQTFKEWLQSQV
jgi:YbbR domain-containing protein